MHAASLSLLLHAHHNHTTINWCSFYRWQIPFFYILFVTFLINLTFTILVKLTYYIYKLIWILLILIFLFMLKFVRFEKCQDTPLSTICMLTYAVFLNENPAQYIYIKSFIDTRIEQMINWNFLVYGKELILQNKSLNFTK